MKFNQKMRNILFARIQWTFDKEQLCGCFTYAEIVYLHDVLKVTNKYDEKGKPHWTIDYARRHMKEGLNGRTWFYFDPQPYLCPPEKRHDIK